MSDDLISRQAAIDAVMGEPTDAHYPSWYAERLEQLPSAQPEQKWIPCSERLPEIDETREVTQALNEFADKLEEIQNKYKNNDEISYTPEEVGEILRTEGQEHGGKYGFKLGDTIKFTPSEVEKILKTKICTYRETGCGSCEHPQSCPYKAESEDIARSCGRWHRKRKP